MNGAKWQQDGPQRQPTQKTKKTNPPTTDFGWTKRQGQLKHNPLSTILKYLLYFDSRHVVFDCSIIHPLNQSHSQEQKLYHDGKKKVVNCVTNSHQAVTIMMYLSFYLYVLIACLLTTMIFPLILFLLAPQHTWHVNLNQLIPSHNLIYSKKRYSCRFSKRWLGKKLRSN